MHHFLLILAIFYLQITTTRSQSLAVPTQWRKPTSNVSRSDRQVIAKSVIDSVLSHFNGSTGSIDGLAIDQSAHFLSSVVLYDNITSSSTNQAAVRNIFHMVPQVYPKFLSRLCWGLAAMHAYRAYGDTSFLQIAISTWGLLNNYSITPDEANVGRHPLKDTPILPSCNGETSAGGVFWTRGRKSTIVNGETVCAFMALSAYLFEATKDTKYYDAASLSAKFIKRQLYNGTIIVDSIDLSNCSSNVIAITYNSGFFIEGLSVFASYDRSDDWANFLTGLIGTTINFSGWTGFNGVITEASNEDASTNTFIKTLKGIFIRGLYTAWKRSAPDSDEAKLIGAYILVQYNALLDLASAPGFNEFSPSWPGPPVFQHLPWGQAAAIHVLNAAIDMVPPLEPSATTTTKEPLPTGTPNPSSGSDNNGGQPSATSSHRRTNTGLIIALSISGAVLICVVLVLLRFFYKQRLVNSNGVLNRDLSQSPDSFMESKKAGRATPPSSLTTIEPFLLTNTTPVRPPEKLVSSRAPPPNPVSTVAPSSITLLSTLVELTDRTPENSNDNGAASRAGPSSRRSFVPVRAETLAYDDV